MSQVNINTKREEWTPHGPVEYETAECQNCGDEIVADSVVEVGVGVVKRRCSFSTCSGGGYKVSATAPLCPYCAEHVLGYTGEPTGITAAKWMVGNFMNNFLKADWPDKLWIMGLLAMAGLFVVMMIGLMIQPFI